MKSIFKQYDIRGKYPRDINEKIIYRLGQALVHLLNADRIAVASDHRESSPILVRALIKGIISQECDVFHLGPVPTGLVPFAVYDDNLDGGVMVTASHLEKKYAGLKLFRSDGTAIGSKELEKLFNEKFRELKNKGYLMPRDISYNYLDWLLDWVDSKQVKPLKIKLDFSGGPTRRIASYVFDQLPCKIVSKKFDLGARWDKDGDRINFIDEKGREIHPYFITALLARIIQEKYPGCSVLHDEKLKWAIQENVKGRVYPAPTGWSNFLLRMKKEKILFGGEASGHYFFNKDCLINDGMLPVLLVIEYISKTGQSLGKILKLYQKKYFISGELNFEGKIDLKKIEKKYPKRVISHLDGLSIEYPDWRFNLRPSGTEAVMRLNIEARTKPLLELKKAELLRLLQTFQFKRVR